MSDPIKAQGLIDGMIANGLTADSTDPGMRGLTRYGRLPQGINGKAKYVAALGKPFVQRVKHWAPMTRYSIDLISKAYGVDLKSPDRPKGIRKKRTSIDRVRSVANPDAIGVLAILLRARLYIEPIASIPGAHRIICPWLCQHTDQDQTGTVYFEPSEENGHRGGFKCHHGHCQHRKIGDLHAFADALQRL